MPEFTEGVVSDGAVVLRDGEPVSVGEVVRLLNGGERSSAAAQYYRELLVRVVDAAMLFKTGAGLFVGLREDANMEELSPGLPKALLPILKEADSREEVTLASDDSVQPHGV